MNLPVLVPHQASLLWNQFIPSSLTPFLYSCVPVALDVQTRRGPLPVIAAGWGRLQSSVGRGAREPILKELSALLAAMAAAAAAAIEAADIKARVAAAR